jgi:hypothetical protein
MSVTVSGVFASRPSLLRAVRELRAQGLDGLDVMMPAPDHEILAAMPHPPTRVNWTFSMWGGIFGVCLGLLFPAWAHVFIFAQKTGGKPVVSWPAFMVPGFEMMILFTGIFTLIGIFTLCRLPRRAPDPHFDPRATEDHYVLLVEAPEDRVGAATEILRAAGAEVR